MVTIAPEKKSKAKQRHVLVAESFKRWLERNPKAPLSRQANMLDAISDSVLLEEQLRKSSGERRN